MRARAGRQKPDLRKTNRVNKVEAAGHHIRHIEHLTTRVDLNVLRHAPDGQVPDNGRCAKVHLDQLAGELAGGNKKRSVSGKVDMVDAWAVDPELRAQLPGMRIVEVQSLQRLGDDDRVLPVRGEVHVVGVVNTDVRSFDLPSGRVDRGQAVAVVVGDVQR